MNDPRCLIADDHPALTSAVSSYLSENGFDVVGPASDGRRAVALITDEKPDLALVDYRMPRLSGADLVRALEAALNGSSYLDPALVKNPAPGGKLTPRELDVLGLLAEGLQHEEIGRRLGISSETVRTHLRKASDRLGASTRTQAVATALRLGLIT